MDMGGVKSAATNDTNSGENFGSNIAGFESAGT